MATVNYVPYARQSRTVLGRVAEYICRKDKTDDRRFISGQNCAPLFAAQEFAATRALHGKDSPVWFYHYTQSFSPKTEVSPERVHEIAKEFAAQAWPGCEVLIATHVDAKHKHSHFLVNAVRADTGMMLRQGPKTLERLRKISDGLCLRHGLPVLGQRPKQGQGMSAREYRSAEKGESWKFQLVYVIRDAMRHARSRQEFEDRLRRQGYEVRWTAERKNITYTTPAGMKCRDVRLHQERFLKEAMEREFRIREQMFFGRIDREEPTAGAAGTEHADAPDGGGLDAAAGGGRVHSFAGTVPYAGGMAAHDDDVGGAAGSGEDRPRRDANAPDTGAADGVDQGAEAGQGDAPTGWEKEREDLIAAVFGSGPVGVHKEASAGDPDRAGDLGSAVGAAVGLFHRLEDLQNAPPVRDATTRSPAKDRKQRRKEQEKKKALGHKENDTGGWDWEMRM